MEAREVKRDFEKKSMESQMSSLKLEVQGSKAALQELEDSKNQEIDKLEAQLAQLGSMSNEEQASLKTQLDDMSKVRACEFARNSASFLTLLLFSS